MGRTILAILAGMALWALLWNLGTMGALAAFPDHLQPEQPITHLGMLLAFIAYSVVLSLAAGYVTGSIARRMTPVWVLAGIQLTLGIIAQVSFWSLMPVWYHLIFLALVVPATVLGGRWAVQRRGVPVAVPA